MDSLRRQLPPNLPNGGLKIQVSDPTVKNAPPHLMNFLRLPAWLSMAWLLNPLLFVQADFELLFFSAWSIPSSPSFFFFFFTIALPLLLRHHRSAASSLSPLLCRSSSHLKVTISHSSTQHSSAITELGKFTWAVSHVLIS